MSKASALTPELSRQSYNWFHFFNSKEIILRYFGNNRAFNYIHLKYKNIQKIRRVVLTAKIFTFNAFLSIQS